MKYQWRFVAGVAVVACLAAACVELTGQRIAWFHDIAKDELGFVIAYDGIHDKPTSGGLFSESKKGSEQLPEFVASGDVMLSDWPFHFQRKLIDAELGKPDTTPSVRALLERVKSTSVEAVAHYRDARGRIGALQRVSFPGIGKTLELANAALREAILLVEPGDGVELPATLARIRNACAKGHTFLALDGQAFVVTVPIDHEEWQHHKRMGAEQLIENVVKFATKDERGRQEDIETAKSVLGMLTSVPFAYSDDGDMLRVVIGDRTRPNTLRMTIRDEYEPNLEADVTKLVPHDLDEELVQAAIGGGAEGNADLAAIRAYGPPELLALALARTADDANSPLAKKAREMLASLASEWNAEGRYPKAPTSLPDGGSYTDAAIAFAKGFEVGAR